jgi:hypothetical protein
MLSAQKLTSSEPFRIIGGMDASRLAYVRTQLERKHEELETLVRSGLPFTDPAVLSLSEELDRLVLVIQGSGKPTPTLSWRAARLPREEGTLEEQGL